ncbi:hypothetical protein [Polyangium sp. y55x31]|uniref:hypothetical protein n=1 Tax=Polyangium sp. y55x31 TaxID=3042688 RepID=UPI002482D974|nr:hypothetical protein [Polyangium sp. y55x31]MDI1484833.1 hypothetical protein [Polyangium sp. y55x31]
MDSDTRRRVYLLAAVADLHPETARAALEGKPMSRKTRDALRAARANVSTVRDELGAVLDRLTANETASTAGAASSASMPSGAAALA